jgi:hypothetical protein
VAWALAGARNQPIEMSSAHPTSRPIKRHDAGRFMPVHFTGEEKIGTIITIRKTYQPSLRIARKNKVKPSEAL